MDADRIITEVIQNTQNDFILLVVLIIVALVIFIIPLYGMMLKDRKAKLSQESSRQDKYIEREKQIIEVIKENSAVIAGLKVTLDQNGAATNTSLGRIHERIDEKVRQLNEISGSMGHIKATLEASLGNQKEMSGKINKMNSKLS